MHSEPIIASRSVRKIIIFKYALSTMFVWWSVSSGAEHVMHWTWKGWHGGVWCRRQLEMIYSTFQELCTRFVIYCALLQVNITHILQGYIMDTGAIPASNPEIYGKVHIIHLLSLIIWHNKINHSKAVCVLYEIPCIYLMVISQYISRCLWLNLWNTNIGELACHKTRLFHKAGCEYHWE